LPGAPSQVAQHEFFLREFLRGKSLRKQGTYRFDGFLLDGRERKLERDGVPIRTGPKVFDALQLLVENAGMLVERPVIREHLWPGQIVEDGTLTRVIADLRKALGELGDERRYIETVPKFGYRFTAKVEAVEQLQPALPVSESLPPPQLVAPPEVRVVVAGSTRRWTFAIGALLCLVVLGFGIQRARTHTRLPAVPSLLILPFEVIGRGLDAEMLGLGLQDSLTMELSGLKGLAVIKLKSQPDAADDFAEIGRRHQTAFVLAGTVQLNSDRMLVNARLIRSETGQTVWTQHLEEPREDLFLIESKLAKLTVAELVTALAPLEGERLTGRVTTNGLAYRFYLLGRHYWNQRDENAYTDAIAMFKKSAEVDPHYAPAWVGLADSYLMVHGSVGKPSEGDIPMARAAIEKAIEIDPLLGDAHATLGMISGTYYFDWARADREFQTAIRLSPNYLTGHHWYAEFLTMMGKFGESEGEFEVARNLDPASSIVLTDLAQLYNFEKKYQRSINMLDEVLKLEPSFHLAHYRKGYALMLMRRPQDAMKEFETANGQAGPKRLIAEQAWAYAVEGKGEQATEWARKAESDGPDAFLLSVVWAELGDANRAMDWLQKMYDVRGGGLISLKVNPVFDRLRSNERFCALLRRMMM
jgi:DNA-binding winged helix-turn-helix (wHTH) protein/TolB-like protein